MLDQKTVFSVFPGAAEALEGGPLQWQKRCKAQQLGATAHGALMAVLQRYRWGRKSYSSLPFKEEEVVSPQEILVQKAYCS